MIKTRFDASAFEKLDFTMRQVKRVVVASVVDLDRELKKANPVDTGFMRASWWPMINGAPGRDPTPPVKPRRARKGEEQEVLDASPQPSVAEIAAGIGGIITLVNSAEYAGIVNEKGTPQRHGTSRRGGACRREAVEPRLGHVRGRGGRLSAA